MAFIYNLTDSWTDAATTWNGIKLAVTNTSSSASSNLLNLTVTGATTASFVVDKSGNLVLNGSVNKITMTAPATGATLTLADGSSFITSGAYSTTFTTTGTTTLTLPTSGTVTALGNSTTGSGSIVLDTSPTLVTPALGTPSSGVLSSCTGYAVGNLTGTGTGVLTALAVNVGSAGAFVTFNGALGTPSSGNLGNCTGYPVSGLGGLGTGVATALAVNVGSAGAFVVNGGALGTPSSGTLTNATGLPISTGVDGLGTGVATFLATPSSANLASAVTDETGSGSLVFGTSPTISSPTITGTATFNGSTSGTVAFKAPAIAGTTTFTLPAGNGTSGYVLVTDGLGNTSWASSGGAAGNAAGVDKNVQFNDAGSMAGNAAFNFDKSTASLSLGTASVTTGKLAFYNGATANATTIQAGSASAAVTYTLPTADGTNGQALITNGSGALSWTTVASGLTVGTSAITGGTSGRILYDNAGVLGEKTVTGTDDVVLATSPTLVTPTLGVAAAASINKVAITAPATGSTLTIADGKTLTASNTLTFTGTDGSSVAFGTGGTVLFSGGALGTPSSGTLTNCTGLPVSTGVSGLGTNVATFLATPSSANLAAAVTDETGSGALVFGTSPTFTTSALFPAGSVSAPGIAASGDTDTGIYFPAANQVALATNGTAALTVDSSQNVSVTGTLAMGSSFKRNRIINGDMRVDQRAAGTVTPTAGGYRVDRWETTAPAASKYSVQQSSTAPTGFVNSLLITSLSAYTVGASEGFLIQQQVEGLNIADLNWGSANAQTVTISFWVRSSLTGTFGGALRNSDNSRSYPFSYTIIAANTWEQKSVTIAGDTSGTWLTTNGSGIKAAFSFGSGATISGTAGSWASANYQSATGATSVVGTNGATFYITGVQLEVGSVATPYERQIYSEQLAQCQRYCQFYGGTNLAGLAVGLYVSATEAQSMTPYLAPMRTTPSATVTNSTGAFEIRDGGGTVSLATVKTSLGVSSMLVYQDTGISGKTAGQALYFRSGPSTYGSIILSAEL